MAAALKSSSKGNSIGRARSPGERRDRLRSPTHARKVGFPPSHTQVDWRLYVEGEEEADAEASPTPEDDSPGLEARRPEAPHTSTTDEEPDAEAAAKNAAALGLSDDAMADDDDWQTSS